MYCSYIPAFAFWGCKKEQFIIAPNNCCQKLLPKTVAFFWQYRQLITFVIGGVRVWGVFLTCLYYLHYLKHR